MATARVLIVDDEPDARDALRELVRIWGYEAEVAADGSEAITRALERRPEVVLLDLWLPDMDGHDVARRIRAECGQDGPAVVAFTGSEDEDGAGGGLFDAYVLKPADPEALRLIVEGALKSRA
jgi:two-component system, sensor histidine kinase